MIEFFFIIPADLTPLLLVLVLFLISPRKFIAVASSIYYSSDTSVNILDYGANICGLDSNFACTQDHGYITYNLKNKVERFFVAS